MRVLLAAIVVGLARDILETLPANERDAGIFVSGMAWALLIFVMLLLVATWSWARVNGVAL